MKYRVRKEALLDDVSSMRQRMRQQLDRSESGSFDLKQGEGGIADIEFIVQYLVLGNAASHPAVIHYSDNIRQLGTLAAASSLPDEDVLRLQEIYKTYRLRMHHLVLDEQPPLVPDTEFKDQRAFVNMLWSRTMQ